MGLAIQRDTFTHHEYDEFVEKLNRDLSALKELLHRPGFGCGQTTIGAELEFYIVDKQGDVSPINQQLIDEIADPQLQLELNRYNLEYNFKPRLLAGASFTETINAMAQATSYFNRFAQRYDATIVPVGILPTLKPEDFSEDCMTNIPRYRALSEGIKALRGEPFKIKIDGKEPIEITTNEMTLEGANTSFQFHLRVTPDEFVDVYNALQLVTPVALALAANSPTLFGHMLWDETRVSLFKQSIDSRKVKDTKVLYPPRVSFGEGWVRESAWELFAQSVAFYAPLIPLTDTEDALSVVRSGGIPRLHQLCLHQGTTWPWNRVIYDHNDGGHLRIEMRSLPAGPSHLDMMANAFFMIGACYAFKDHMKDLLPSLPFKCAERNFYQAAKHGIDAKLMWPSFGQNTLKEVPILDIARDIMPHVESALEMMQVNRDDIQQVMAIIGGRINNKMTGARWQRQVLKKLCMTHTREEACHILLQRYIQHFESGLPVSEWSVQV